MFTSGMKEAIVDPTGRSNIVHIDDEFSPFRNLLKFLYGNDAFPTTLQSAMELLPLSFKYRYVDYMYAQYVCLSTDMMYSAAHIHVMHNTPPTSRTASQSSSRTLVSQY
jgi:hypothetical protein